MCLCVLTVKKMVMRLKSARRGPGYGRGTGSLDEDRRHVRRVAHKIGQAALSGGAEAPPAHFFLVVVGRVEIEPHVCFAIVERQKHKTCMHRLPTLFVLHVLDPISVPLYRCSIWINLLIGILL